jgi:hypothetical protein
MNRRNGWLVLTILLFGLAADRSQAAVARFHYVPADDQGNTTLQPIGPCGSPGEYVIWFGAVRKPYTCMPRPNRMVTLCHPHTGRNITVPIALPAGTPIIQHKPNWLIYDYGTYTVSVQFFPDGSVDVVYNSGLFREL